LKKSSNFATQFYFLLKQKNMSKRYETVFILTPVLSGEQAKEAVKIYKDLLTDKGAIIKHEEDWGLRKLAYQIQKKSTGFYYLIEWDYSGQEQVVPLLELTFKRDERVLRYLTVQLDKYAIEYNERKRKAKSEVVEEQIAPVSE
jgi:small subunit ribosomal protein S6